MALVEIHKVPVEVGGEVETAGQRIMLVQVVVAVVSEVMEVTGITEAPTLAAAAAARSQSGKPGTGRIMVGAAAAAVRL